MTPMADVPLTLDVLDQFYREVMRPDFERAIGEAFAGSEGRMQANFDAILHKLERLETRRS